jgi:hypothetical protein
MIVVWQSDSESVTPKSKDFPSEFLNRVIGLEADIIHGGGILLLRLLVWI